MKMNCYGSPVAALPDFDQMVYRTIKDARGVFRTRGLSVKDVALRFGWHEDAGTSFGRLRRAKIRRALERLTHKGLIRPAWTRRIGVHRWRLPWK